MDWRAKVDLFEQIRREYEFGNGSIKSIARKFGVHRRMVRQALRSALPPERKRPERERPSLAPVMPFIDGILEADRRAPRKQRHTAHRIHARIRAEIPGHAIAESTVRRYVRRIGRTNCLMVVACSGSSPSMGCPQLLITNSYVNFGVSSPVKSRHQR